jgi:hypothetical protein
LLEIIFKINKERRNKMAEKVPKIKFDYYDVGNVPGNYFRSYQSSESKIYHANGFIAGKNIQMEGKDLAEIENKFLDFLTNTHRECAINLSTCEGLEAQIKEGGLVKLVKEEEEEK